MLTTMTFRIHHHPRPAHLWRRMSSRCHSSYAIRNLASCSWSGMALPEPQEPQGYEDWASSNVAWRQYEVSEVPLACLGLMV